MMTEEAIEQAPTARTARNILDLLAWSQNKWAQEAEINERTVQAILQEPSKTHQRRVINKVVNAFNRGIDGHNLRYETTIPHVTKEELGLVETPPTRYERVKPATQHE